MAPAERMANQAADNKVFIEIIAVMCPSSQRILHKNSSQFDPGSRFSAGSRSAQNSSQARCQRVGHASEPPIVARSNSARGSTLYYEQIGSARLRGSIARKFN